MSTQPSRLGPLRAGITELYTTVDRETAAIRGAHLQAVVRLSPFAMVANAGSGVPVAWAFSDDLSIGLASWFVLLLLLSGLGLLNAWRQRRRAYHSASPRAIHRATWHACVLAGLWAVLPMVWFPAAAPAQQLVVATLFTGLLGAGTLMLSLLALVDRTARPGSRRCSGR